MMGCKRCGACCNSLSFWMGKERMFDNDPLEIKRWAEYHNCKVKKHPETGEMGIEIPMTCKFLVIDKEGKPACAIYEKRPKVCRDYLCDKAKEQ